jgi:hypothetical protein
MFSIEDPSDRLIDWFVQKHTEGFRTYNHKDAWHRFQLPSDLASNWIKVHDQNIELYTGPTGEVVRGIVVRCERHWPAGSFPYEQEQEQQMEMEIDW